MWDLCGNCQTFRTGLPWLSVHTFSSCIETQATTCHGCAIIQKALGLFAPASTTLSIYLSPNKEEECPVSWLTIGDEMMGMGELGGLQIVLHAVDGTPNPWNLTSLNLSSFPSTGSPAAIDLALKWMNDCVENHGRCHAGGDPLLPTRILDIGATASERITLCEPIDQRAPYLCLSYCWGNADFIQTRKETLRERKEGILVQHLPRTFQECIQVARALGFRYLWIDSLCIIQDSLEDWEREAGKMAEIYHNSHLTIAAALAGSPDDGCFTTSSMVEIDSVRAQVIDHFPNQPGKYSSTGFPLLTRGWGYQERMLAPRVLYFGPGEIVWECFETRKCECGKAHQLRDEVHKTIFFDTLFQQESIGRDSLWRHIVVQYSALALTEPLDKLPAVSGLAEHMRRASRQVYLAGLWKETLAIDLLWYRQNEFGPVPTFHQRSSDPRDPTWRAPSWSWASVDGIVMYHHWLYLEPQALTHELYCAILDAECSPAGQSMTGRLASGSIRLQCPMLSVVRPGKVSFLDELTHYLHLDREIFSEQGVYLLRMARIRESLEIFLVVRAVDPSRQIFERIGLANRNPRVEFPWPETRDFITLI